MNTRAIVWSAVGLFWSGVVVLAVLASRDTSASPPAASGAGPASDATDAKLSAASIARHATPEDCWIRVGTGVYDVSRYIPEHPTAPNVITDYCGKDASWAFQTKTRGRDHSARAYRMLEDYRVGSSD